MILGVLAILLALMGNWTAAWWVFGIYVFVAVVVAIVKETL